MSNTYYVLYDDMSTFPILVPLHDYCRKQGYGNFNNSQEAVKLLGNKGYQAMQKKSANNGEVITIFYKNYSTNLLPANV